MTRFRKVREGRREGGGVHNSYVSPQRQASRERSAAYIRDSDGTGANKKRKLSPPTQAAKRSRNVATVPQAHRDVRLGEQRASLPANQAAASSSSLRSAIAAQQAALTGRRRRAVEEQVRRDICGSEMRTQYLFFSQLFSCVTRFWVARVSNHAGWEGTSECTLVANRLHASLSFTCPLSHRKKNHP